MNTSSILKNKIFLYLTEFFAGMSVMAVEQPASCPVFQLFPDCVDDHHRNHYDRDGAGEHLRREERG